MKEHLERIDGVAFAALNHLEARSMIGGSETQGATQSPTMIASHKDVHPDLTDDAPAT